MKIFAASFHCGEKTYLLPIKLSMAQYPCSGSLIHLVAVPGGVREGKPHGGFGFSLLQKAALAHGSVCEGCKERLVQRLELFLMQLWDVG